MWSVDEPNTLTGGNELFHDCAEVVRVGVDNVLLGVVGAFIGDEDPELADLIMDLHLVRVNSFSFRKSNDEDVRDMIDGLSTDLNKDDWENIIKVRERGEREEMAS